MHELTLFQALEKYYAFLDRYRSPNTLQMYRGILCRTVPVLGAAKSIRDITAEDLDRLLEALLKPDHTEATQATYKRTVNIFFNWLVRRQYLDVSPVDFPIKQITRDPLDTSKAISDEDIDKILDACRNLRDEALVIFYRDSAFRLGGAWNLLVEGIDWDAQTVTSIETKNNHNGQIVEELHTVFLSEDLSAALRVWLAERARLVAGLPEDHGYVFVNLKTGERLTRWGLISVMRRLGERSGVKQFSAHKFRHAWAVWAASHGVSVPETQSQLGHSSPKTTMDFYYKAPPESLRDAVNRRADSSDGDEGEEDVQNDGDEEKEDDGKPEPTGMLEPAGG